MYYDAMIRIVFARVGVGVTAVGIRHVHRIVQPVRICVPRLRIVGVGTCTLGVWGHEAAHGGGIESRAEVIEVGFTVAFFAGEVEGTGTVTWINARAALEVVAKGKASAGFGVVADACADALRAEPIGVVEDHPGAARDN
jgi:hypothetical protein